MHVHRKLKVFLSVYVDDFKIAGEKESLLEAWKLLKTKIKICDPMKFSDNVYLGCEQEDIEPEPALVDEKRNLYFKHLTHGNKDVGNSVKRKPKR